MISNDWLIQPLPASLVNKDGEVHCDLSTINRRLDRIEKILKTLSYTLEIVIPKEIEHN